ncbi:hypothetical protein JHK82_024534 [Glycine max]|nr:hypothetical protein JHK82_024534 [Glycine max]
MGHTEGDTQLCGMCSALATLIVGENKKKNIKCEAFALSSSSNLRLPSRSLSASEHRVRRTRASSQVSASSPSPPYLGMFRLLRNVFSFSLSSSPSKLSCSLCSPSTLKLYVLHQTIVLSKVEHRARRTRASSEVCASSPSPPHEYRNVERVIWITVILPDGRLISCIFSKREKLEV